MQVPQISAKEFLILSALIDGHEKPNADVLKEIEWSNCKGFFIKTSIRLHRAGLIKKVWFKQDGKPRGKARIQALSITNEGRQTWIETADFYLFMAKRCGLKIRSKTAYSAAALTDSADVISRKEVEAVNRQRLDFRHPTPREEQRLLESATPEFSRLYRVYRLSKLHHIGRLFAADVTDVDYENGILYLNSQVIVLDEATLALVTEVAEDRTSGPLFLTPQGCRWRQQHASLTFRKMRNRAGLPKEIVLCGSLKGFPRTGGRKRRY